MNRYYQTSPEAGLDLKTPQSRGYDSGFSDTFSSIPLQTVFADSPAYTSVPPAPPHLLLGQEGMEDVENGDSGITVDEVEKDHCVPRDQVVAVQEASSHASMEVESTKVTSRGSGSRSPVSKAKRHAPRLPKRTYQSAFTLTTTSGSSVKTVTTRSASPKSVYTGTEPHSSTQTAPFVNKENQGPSTMSALRSSSPLTCNNFQSLNTDNRVPPIGHHVPIDIYQLRDYMNFFLQDTKEGDTGFHLAVIHNQPDLLDKLLFIMSKDRSLRPVLDEQNCLFQTALHLATHLQQLDMMRKLLLAGASIDIPDHKGNTPLHIAAKFSSTRPLEEIAKYISIHTLLRVSETRNNEGLSCVHVAAKNGNMEILRKFRNLGLDMNMQDFNSGKTALHLAAENNSLSNVQFLLEMCDADVNSLTYSGCSPLHIASGRSDISIVAYLISMGADPELCTDEDDVALDLAGSEDVRAFLAKVAALKFMF